MSIKEITSFSNVLIKHISSLKDKKYSKKHNLFIVEGFEFVLKAINNNWNITHLLYSSLAEQNQILPNIITAALNQKVDVIKTNNAILKKITAKENTQKIIAVVKTKINLLDNLCLQPNTNYLALNNIRDAGNLGTIIRSCVAFSIPAILLIGETIYPFNLEAVRASVGFIFDIQIYSASELDFLNFIKQKKVNLIGADANSNNDFRKIKYTNTNIIIMGNEKEGLALDISKICNTLVKIPQNKHLNSLNLSVAASLMLFQAQQDKL